MSGKMHECTITTLKNQYKGKFGPPKKGFYLFCQNISNLQYHDVEGYYQEVCNPGMRGGMSKTNGKTRIFDIATNPSPCSIEKVRDGFIAILKEKIFNDIETYRKLVEQMLNDGKIKEKDVEKMFVDIDTIFNKMDNDSNYKMSWKVKNDEIINYSVKKEKK